MPISGPTGAGLGNISALADWEIRALIIRRRRQIWLGPILKRCLRCCLAVGWEIGIRKMIFNERRCVLRAIHWSAAGPGVRIGFASTWRWEKRLALARD